MQHRSLDLTRIVRSAFALGVLAVSSAHRAGAQGTGAIEGTIISQRDGIALPGVTVFVEGQTNRVQTDARGLFRLSNVTAGTHRVTALRLGYRQMTSDVAVASGKTARADFKLAEAAALVEAVTVTASRGTEERPKELPVTLSVLPGEEITNMRPTHVAETLNRLAGVHIVAFGGADMHTAVRYPLGPKATALYMEDGIPFAPSSIFAPGMVGGVDFASAGQIEALKGPGTAAYGSDAVTGVVHFITGGPPVTPKADVALEGGPYGFKRALISTGGTFGANGLLLTSTITDQDGRNSDPAKQISANARWNLALDNGAQLRTVVSYTRRDANWAVGQTPDEFKNRVFFNPYPGAWDNSDGVRASTSYEQTAGATSWRVTPYFRYQNISRTPSWQLGYDPVVWDIDYKSVGFLSQMRHQFTTMQAQLTAGIDADYSPLNRRVLVITPVSRNGQWVDIQTSIAPPHYDYSANYGAGAAYGQFDFDPVQKLRVSLGARFDASGYDYHTRLTPTDTGNFKRPADASPSYSKMTPKLGVTYSFTDETKLFGSFRRGFRVPTENQLFAQGASASSIDLKPVEVESYELGFRTGNERARIEVASYYMTLHNDIISYRAASNVAQLTNNGESNHRGVEITGGLALTSDLRADLAYTYSRARYDNWRPSTTIDFSGKEMESAPRHLRSGTLTYQPRVLNGGRIQLEWNGMSDYLLDPGSTFRVDGYNIFHLRASYVVARRVELYARAMNFTDQTYSVQSFTGYGTIPWTATPGEYRSFYAGAQMRLF